MDPQRFDTLARTLATSGSRRRFLAGLAAGALGLIGLRSAEAATCRDAGRTCSEHAHCCSGLCGPKDATGRRRCHCLSSTDCRVPDQCHAATCVAGVCGETVLLGQACNDGSACTTGETCQANGSCGGGAPVVCTAQDQCHSASCDPVAGCVQTLLLGATCSDGNACTAGETCQADGSCAGGAAVADATVCSGGLCCGGTCVAGATCCGDADCDTGFVCSLDVHTCKNTNPSPQCAGFSYCGTYSACAEGAGACLATAEGGGFCSPNYTPIFHSIPCTSSADCPIGDLCMDIGCTIEPPAPGYYCSSGTLIS